MAPFSLPHGLRTIKGEIASPTVNLKYWIDSAKDVAGNPRYTQFLTACFLMGIAYMQVFNLLALTSKRFGIPPSTYGIIMGFNGVLIMLIEVPLTHSLKQFSSTRVLAIGYVLIGLGCIVFGLSSGIVSFFIGMAVFTLGEIIALPIGMAYSSNLAPESMRGRYFGFRGMTWALAGLIGSAGVWLYGQLGSTWWYCSGVIALLGAICLLKRS